VGEKRKLMAAASVNGSQLQVVDTSITCGGSGDRRGAPTWRKGYESGNWHKDKRQIFEEEPERKKILKSMEKPNNSNHTMGGKKKKKTKKKKNRSGERGGGGLRQRRNRSGIPPFRERANQKKKGQNFWASPESFSRKEIAEF